MARQPPVLHVAHPQGTDGRSPCGSLDPPRSCVQVSALALKFTPSPCTRFPPLPLHQSLQTAQLPPARPYLVRFAVGVMSGRGCGTDCPVTGVG